VNDNAIRLPVYAKLTVLLVGLLAFIGFLYIATNILIPIIFAFIIAIVLSPVVSFLVRHKTNRLFAIILVLTVASCLIIALAVLIFSQFMHFQESWSELLTKLTVLLKDIVNWTAGILNIKSQSIYLWIENTKENLINSGGRLIGQSLMVVGTSLVMFFLIPVYVFLILYYQPLIIDFIKNLSGSRNKVKVFKIVFQAKNIVQQYLIGLIIEFFIIAALYTVTLFALGIEYALLLGVVGSLLNIIPYIGGIVGVALPMIVAILTKTSAWYAVYVMAIYYLIQLVDNNIIVPKIVSSKVKLNAFFSIVVIFAGNALWGISGMFLSVPLLAIVKLICDNVESLKPWGGLMGNVLPKSS
jgi:predicted PurR-regulated permease PerM